MKNRNVESVEQGLCLDEIYKSSDPAVRRYLMQAMREETQKAEERAILRVAHRFSHLLPIPMRQVLEQQLLAV